MALTLALAFSGTLLAERSLLEAAPVCGDPVTPLVTIVRNGDDIVLSWPYAWQNNGPTTIYTHSRDPYFVPVTPLASLPGSTTAYTVTGVLATPGTASFYVVRTSNTCNGMSPDSNRVGAQTYTLLADDDGYSQFVVPFETKEFADADGLQRYLSCYGATSTLLMKWALEPQDFRFYLPTGYADRFPVVVGDVIFARLRSTTGKIGFVGEVAPVEHPVRLSSYSALSIPMQSADLTTAAKLASDLGTVESVLQWNAGAQRWDIYYPTDPDSDYELSVALPVFAKITDRPVLRWPSDTSRLVWAQTYDGGRKVYLNWAFNDDAMGLSADGFDVYRKIGGAGSGGWTHIARASFASDATAMAGLLGQTLLNALYADLGTINQNTITFDDPGDVYAYLVANPDYAALLGERYHQVALATGHGYIDQSPPSTGTVAYYVVPAGLLGPPTHRPICVVQSPVAPLPVGLVESPVVYVPQDVGVRPSPRALSVPERYNWSAYQEVRRLDGQAYLFWDDPTPPAVPIDPWACVESPALSVAGYHVYRNGPLTTGDELVNPLTASDQVVLVKPGTQVQAGSPDDATYTFRDDLLEDYGRINAIYAAWTYRVCAVDWLGHEQGCGSRSVVIRELEDPQAPLGVAIAVSSTHTVLTVTVTYSDTAELSNPIRLFVSRSPTLTLPSEEWLDLTPTGLSHVSAPTFTVAITDTPPENIPQWYRVQVRDNAGNWSPLSAPVRGALYDRDAEKLPTIPAATECLDDRFPLSLTGLELSIRQVVLYRSFESATGPWNVIGRFRVDPPGSVTITEDYMPPYAVDVWYAVEAVDDHGNVSTQRTFCAHLDPGDVGPDWPPQVTVTDEGNFTVVETEWVDGDLPPSDEGPVITVTHASADGPVTTVITGTLTALPITVEQGESVQVTASDGDGNETSVVERRTNDFMDTDRQMTFVGAMADVAWASVGGVPRVHVTLEKDNGNEPPLVALFRRPDTPTGQWLQVSSVTRVDYPLLMDGEWVITDTADLSPNMPYVYTAVAVSPYSSEALGVWQDYHLPAMVSAQTVVTFGTTLAPAPTLPASCYGHIEAMDPTDARLPERLLLYDGWSITVSKYWYSNDTGECRIPDRPEADNAYGEGTLENRQGDSYPVLFMAIRIDPSTGEHLDGRIVATLSESIAGSASQFPVSFGAIELLPRESNAEVTISLPATINAFHKRDRWTRSNRIGTVVSGVGARDWTFQMVYSAEDLFLVDENLPWIFQVGELLVRADSLTLRRVGTRDRLTYPKRPLTDTIPDNNLAYLRAEYTTEEAVLDPQGLRGRFGTNGPLAYLTSFPGGVIVEASGGAQLDVEGSTISGGTLYGGRAELTYSHTGAWFDYMGFGATGLPEHKYAFFLAGMGYHAVPGTRLQTLRMTPADGRLTLGAYGRLVDTVVLEEQVNWNLASFRVLTSTATLYVAAVTSPMTPTNGYGFPAPAEVAWKQLPGPNGGDLDPGVNLNLVHQGYAPVEVVFDCYQDPNWFGADMDLYIRRGGVSENLKLAPDGTPRVNRDGYIETINTYDVQLIDNLIYEADVQFDVYLPYPSDVSLSLRADPFTGLDSGYCPNQGTVEAPVPTVTHKYWGFVHQLGGAFTYSQDLEAYAGADLGAVERVLMLNGTSVITGLRSLTGQATINTPIAFTSQWFPNGDVGQLKLEPPDAPGDFLKRLRVGGFPYPISSVKLSRYYSALMNEASLPDSLGVDVGNSFRQPSSRLVDASGRITSESLKACSVGNAIGCGFVVADGNSSTPHFGEVERPATMAGMAASALVDADVLIGKLPILLNYAEGLTSYLPVWAGELPWEQTLSDIQNYVEERLPVKLLATAEGGVFANVIRNAELLPMDVGPDIGRGDLGVVVAADWDVSWSTLDFTATFGMYMGHIAPLAPFRALAMLHPDIGDADNWGEVEPYVAQWSEGFGYTTGPGDADDVVDLASDTWSRWANDRPFTEAFGRMQSFVHDLDDPLAYTGGGLTTVGQGAVLDTYLVDLQKGMGQMVYRYTFANGFAFEGMQFAAAMDVKSPGIRVYEEISETVEISGTEEIIVPVTVYYQVPYTKTMFAADWVLVELTRDEEARISADNALADIPEAGFDARMDVRAFLTGALKESYDLLEGGANIRPLDMLFGALELANVSAVYGKGHVGDPEFDPGSSIDYFGFQGDVHMSWFNLGGSFLYGSLYDSPILRYAGFTDIVDSLGSAEINGRPQVYTGFYAALHGDFPGIYYGCLLEVSMGGELAIWVFVADDASGATVVGGAFRGSVSGQAACILSARGEVGLTWEVVPPGGQVSPAGWSGFSSTCPAGGEYCTALSGDFFLAVGVGWCSPHSWHKWDRRWWGDSWCYQFGVAAGVIWMTPAYNSNWEFDLDIDFE